MSGAVSQEVGREILRMVREMPELTHLPPTVRIAERMAVSRGTVLAVLRKLRSLGLLSFRNGGAIRIRDRVLPQQQRIEMRSTAVDKLYEAIRNRLESGHYEAGTSLPQLTFFARELRISDHTVRKALRRLEVDGFIHRRGKAWLAGFHPWVERREQLMRHAAERIHPPLQIDRSTLPPDWNEMQGRLKHVRRAIHEGPPSVREAWDQLVLQLRAWSRLHSRPHLRDREDAVVAATAMWVRRAIPRTLSEVAWKAFHRVTQTILLAPLLSAGATALIAPSDIYARQIYYWLEAAGWRVPDNISLVSFDNSPEVLPLPVDSVDFGFHQLGYAAFHAILGDIPMRKDARGNMPAKPYVAGRGSVAAPRKRNLRNRPERPRLR